MKNQFVKRFISLSLCAVMMMSVGKDVNASVRNSQVQKVDETTLEEVNVEVNQDVTTDIIIDEAGGEISEFILDSDVEDVTKEEYSALPAVTIQTVKGYEEGAYVKWTPVSDADGYVVYCSDNISSFTTPIDDTLIRDYGSYMRADMVGLSKGDYYFKVDAVTIDSATGNQTVIASTVTSKAEVTTYDRSGFAFIDSSGKPYMNGTVGAYNADGTLKSGAVVIYLTEWNKNDVKVKIKNGSTSYKDCVGILDILTTIASGKDNRPIDIRVVGCLTDPSGIDSNSNFKGDLAIANNINNQPITLEGIGDDATFNGFGIVLKKCSNVEVRNMAVINCNSDEGDNFSINSNVNNVWMHNNDSFYGEPGGDSDQKKGDGAMDCKRADYVTLSYNHFFDNGKCNLLSVSSEDAGNHITYHHNWYDHSDSRHPRARYYNVHTYNNYFDHNASYGMGATLGASIFAENNYFDSVARPFIVASQGHDLEGTDKSDSSTVISTLSRETAGFIKEYGNVFVNSGSKYSPYDPVSCPYDFDAYKALSRDEKIPDTIKSNVIQDNSDKFHYYDYEGEKYGTTSIRTYSNFDTESTFYSYTVDDANDVPAIVKAHAGRVDGGDFKYTLGQEAKDSGIVKDLKNKLLAYETTLVRIGGIQKTSELTYYTVVFDFNGGENTSHATSTSVKVESGKTVTSLANLPSKTGYTFVRWNDEDGVPFDFSQGINRNITLTAEWKENINIDDTDTSLKLDMADVPKETYSESFTKHGFTIAATQNKTVTVAASSKTVDGVGYTQRLQFGGSGDIGEGYRTIKFTITKKSKLVVVAESASSSLSTGRPLQVSDKNNTYTLKTFTSGDYAAGKFTQELEPGTWYVYSGNGGINVYYIGVEEITGGGTDPDPDPSTDIDYPATKNADGSNTIDLTEGLFAGKTYGSKDVVFSVMENMGFNKVDIKYGDNTYPGFVQGTVNPSPTDSVPTVGAVLVIDSKNIKNGNVKVTVKSPFSTKTKTLYVIKSSPSYKKLVEKEFNTTDNYQFSIDLEPNCQYMLFGSGTKVCMADITYTYEKDTAGAPEPDPDPDPDPDPGIDKNAPFIAVFEDTNSDEYETIYDGSKKEPKVIVTDASGEKLIINSDYTVKYVNNVKATEGSLKKATVTITGKGLYSGNKTLTFDILRKNISDSDIVEGYIEAKPSQPVKPLLAYNGIILKASDYTLHANVKKVPADVPANSTFTYVITGTGNFVGTREMELSVVSEITAKKLVAVQKATKFEYNTNSLFEDIDNSVVVYSATDKDKTAPLENNKDYVVSYSKVLEEENETPVGKYSVVITGRGEYTGQILKTVNVVPAKNEEITVDDIEEKEYSPQGVTVPSDEIIVRDTTNDSVLTQGVDYKVTYANNKAVSTNEKKAKLNITFIGNYQGHKAVSKEFAITKAPINDVKVYATDMIYKGAGIYKAPVYVELNNVIVPVSEYSVNYYLYYDKNNSEENVAMNPQNKLALVDDKAGEDVEEKEVTAVISVKGKNIEAGDIDTTFTVKKSDIDLSKLKVTIYDKSAYNSKTKTYKSVTAVEYTGKEICLEDMSDYSKINDNTETERYYADYQIQKKNLENGKNEWVKVDKSDLKIENVNNVSTGQMTAIISNDSGVFAGTKVLKIKIVPKQMKTFIKSDN